MPTQSLSQPSIRSFGVLLFWLFVTYAFATIGAAGSIDAPLFYGSLNKPEWAPPAWLFGPVWTLLYTLMAIAIWLTNPNSLKFKNTPTILYLLQLALNSLWSWIFFAWQSAGLALVEIIFLLLGITATALHFKVKSSLAAFLLIPYMLWVVFASFLNFAIWVLNPEIFTVPLS